MFPCSDRVNGIVFFRFVIAIDEIAKFYLETVMFLVVFDLLLRKSETVDIFVFSHVFMDSF